MNKEDNFKEQFKQALISTAKVISDDYRPNINKKNSSSKNLDFFELDNLDNRHDFIRLRAETDSGALKKKFSNKEIYKKNLPINSSYRLLYDISVTFNFTSAVGIPKNSISKYWLSYPTKSPILGTKSSSVNLSLCIYSSILLRVSTVKLFVSVSGSSSITQQ